MGFPTDNLRTSDSLISEFICPICVSLVEEPLVTLCSHVFCKNCWQEWAHQTTSTSCPKCNSTAATRSQPQPLQQANPLAWRILSRVEINCPLGDKGCSWKGEYSELSSHLTSSDSHHSQPGLAGEASAAATRSNAEALKEQGNKRFEARAFQEAVKLYSKAITLDPSVANFYSNRAAAWKMLGAVEECISDCRAALALDPAHIKAHTRLAKALCEQGDFDTALALLQEAAQKLPEATEIQEELQKVGGIKGGFEQALQAFNNGDFVTALEIFQAVDASSGDTRTRLWVAKAATEAGLTDKAITITLRILKSDDKNAEAFAVRGIALFHSGDMVQGIKHCREALRLDPDQPQAARSLKSFRIMSECITKAKECANCRQFEEAEKLLTEALALSTMPAKAAILASLFSERASVRTRLKMYEEAMADCHAAISARDDTKDAWLTRASCLIALGRPEDARDEMTALLRMFDNDTLVRHWHQKADFEVRKKTRPNYYAILGISTIATEGEIKMAYKARALVCHPDKAEESARPAAEESFKLLGEALEILGDSMRRKLYDEGYDKEKIEERVAAAQRAARDGDSRGHHHGHYH